MTSFAFMFVEVPEPVWKTSIGNWSSNSPAATRSAAAAIRSPSSGSSSPSSVFTRAAAALIRPSQRTTGTGIVSPETGKFSTAFAVSLPQSSLGAVSLTWSSLSARGSPVSVDEDGPCSHVPLSTSPHPYMGGAVPSTRHPPRNLARETARTCAGFVPIWRGARERKLDRVDRRATVDRALADSAARRLGQRGGRSPAEVPAPRALAGVDATGIDGVRERPRLTASQALDPQPLHHFLCRPPQARRMRRPSPSNEGRISPWSTSAGPSRRGSSRSRCSRRSRPRPCRS